jgi:hypothetical protein
MKAILLPAAIAAAIATGFLSWHGSVLAERESTLRQELRALEAQTAPAAATASPGPAPGAAA